MKVIYYHIATLISKYLQKKETVSDKQEIDEWLNTNDPEGQILDSFKGNRANRDVQYITGLNAAEAYERFNQGKKKNFRHYWMTQAVRAAAVLILFPLAYFIYASMKTNPEPAALETEAKYTQDIGPGSPKGYLKLSDGQLIDLETMHTAMEESNGTAIHKGKSSVSYSSASNESTELIYNTIVVPKAGTYQINLSDGTKVWINALSELSFPVNFVGEERLVHLKGEAYFEVAHDADKPFIVEVDGHRTNVLGTAFNINAYGPMITTLIKGKVEVSNQEGKNVVLKPGYAAVSTGEISVSKANLRKVTAWKDGDFYFKSDPIEEIMEEVSRWYDVEIVYQNTMPQGSKMSGSIARSSNLSEVLEMMEYACGAHFTIKERQVELSF